MDKVSKETRSANMRAIRSKDMKPELAVRRLAHAMGYRYRLHRKDLLGKPDMVFPCRRAVIFVHGCFWHRHKGCSIATTPKSNTAYWIDKFEQNKVRDQKVKKKLQTLGWRVFVVWECEVSSSKKANHAGERLAKLIRSKEN